MSVTLVRLKKRAAELEQKKQFDKALDVYLQILEEGGKELGDDDVPLFNRVGDMLMRKGNVSEALGYYERAVDVYAERGFLNNAIALCSKILRQSPGRTAVYYKLGRISARKGFKSDARKNFLEYADRMQKAGLADEAFRALREFASLYPDQDDVRLILAELLSKENRKGEALEQLQALYEKLEAEGRRAEARATVDRMKAIDPNLVPHVIGTQPAQASSDLVFLDLSEGGNPRPSTASITRAPVPPAARAPIAPPVPALDGLTLTFVPDEDEEPPEITFHPPGFEATAEEDVPPIADLVDVPAPAGTPGAPEIAAVEEHVEGLLDGMESETDIPVLDDLVPTAHEDLVEVDDLVAPLREQPPLSGSEFAGLSLADAPRRPPPRNHDLALPGELPVTPETVISIGETPTSVAAAEDARTAAEEEADLLADIAAREAGQQAHRPAAASEPQAPAAGGEDRPSPDEDAPDDSVSDENLPDEDLEALMFGAADAAGTANNPADDAPSGLADLELDGDVDGRVGDGEREAPDEADDPGLALPVSVEWDAPASPDMEPAAATDDFLMVPPSFGAADRSGHHAFPPLVGLDGAEDAAVLNGSQQHESTSRLHTPRSTLSIGGAEQHLRRRLELEPENWNLRRQLGEALLDVGNREGGLYQLELAMVGFELDGDIDHAAEVVDEILGITPGSTRHHQKRVEYAVRARDRGRLLHAYLELGDALFRNGTADKAVAVYARVLELDGSNERAEFALATLAPDELIRRRGGRARPERWSEELDAIAGSGMELRRGSPDAAQPEGSPPSIEAVLAVVDAAQEMEEEQPSVLPEPNDMEAATDSPVDVAGENERRIEVQGEGDVEPVSAEAAAGLPGLDSAAPSEAQQGDDWTPAPDEPREDGEGTESPEPVDQASAASAEPSGDADRAEASGDADGAEASGDAADADNQRAEPSIQPFATPEAQWLEQPEPIDREPGTASSVPASESTEPDETARDSGEPEEFQVEPVEPDEAAAVVALEGEPLTDHGPTSDVPPTDDGSPAPLEEDVASAPTPAASAEESEDARMSKLEQARRLTPVGTADSDFVDLGEWLRLTEPAKSTRMQVEDPQPTGDEQADFAELLRRFKRGVAENVEAEDYEAHYDLGVAFKEMGLIDEAIAQFQKSLRGTTQRVRSYEALGQCFVEKEQYPIAAALLQRAAELPGTDDQQLVGVLYLLGFATEHMNRPAEALPYYLRVFAVDIEFRDIGARVAAMGNFTK